MRRPYPTDGLTPCDATIEIGQFWWECMGHVTAHRHDGTTYPLNPDHHQSNQGRGEPGDIEVEWWT